MKNNGFTLVELIAVIAILGFLAVIVLPNINSIREGVEQKAYEEKVIQIESAAIEWAYDHLERISNERDGTNLYTKCTFVIIDDLIKQNYLKGDKEDRKKLMNPVNNEEMNNYRVCIKYTFKENNYEHRTLTAEMLSN